MHNYVDHGPISILTKFQTNRPNNKKVTMEGGGGGGAIRHPGQRSAKNSPAWIGLSFFQINVPDAFFTYFTFSLIANQVLIKSKKVCIS